MGCNDIEIRVCGKSSIPSLKSGESNQKYFILFFPLLILDTDGEGDKEIEEEEHEVHWIKGQFL